MDSIGSDYPHSTTPYASECITRCWGSSVTTLSSEPEESCACVATPRNETQPTPPGAFRNLVGNGLPIPRHFIHRGLGSSGVARHQHIGRQSGLATLQCFQANCPLWSQK